MLGCLLRLHAMANCTSLPRSPCLLGCLPDSSSVSSPPHYQGQAQACRGENEELPRYLRGMEALGEQTPSILGLLQRAPGEASSGGESNRWRGPDPDSSILSVTHPKQPAMVRGGNLCPELQGKGLLGTAGALGTVVAPGMVTGVEGKQREGEKSLTEHRTTGE